MSNFEPEPWGRAVEVERPPPAPGGKRLWIGFIVLGVLALALGFTALRGVSGPGTIQGGPPGQGQAPAPTQPVPTQGEPVPLDSDQRVVADARQALAAWGEFAVTGDLGKVEGWFFKEGPQYRKLAAEAPGLRARGLGPPAYRFELQSPRVSRQAADRRVVQGTVVVSRPGEQVQRYRWVLYLRLDREHGRWRLWTVDG